jgi:cell division protein YceG involved in septum cleavage
VNEYNTENDITVYPNPFLEVLNVEIKGLSSPNIHIGIYDLTGRMIVKEKTWNTLLEGHTIVLTKEIPPGAYILKITSNNRTFSTIIIKG